MSPLPEDHPVHVARKAKGMRLQDLAKLIGKSASMLSNVERGFVPKPVTRQRIAEALDSTVAELWPDEYSEML